MEQLNNSPLSDEYVILEDWANLILSPQFNRLKTFLGDRVKRLESESDKLSETPSLDNSVLLATLQARRAELLKLLKKFDYYLAEKRKADMKLKGATNG